MSYFWEKHEKPGDTLVSKSLVIMETLKSALRKMHFLGLSGKPLVSFVFTHM